MHEDHYQLPIILLIVFIGFIGTSMPYPIFPPLFLHSHQGVIIPMSWHTNTRNIFLGIALAAYPLGQFIGLPILGSYSDRYGRKKILMISLVGSFFGYVLSAISLQFHWLWPLIGSRFLTGLLEGNIAIARAMAVDLDSISKYKSLGKINAAASIGYLIGPLLGGFLSDNQLVSCFSFATPFYVAAIFAFIAALFASIKLKNNIPEKAIPTISIFQQLNLMQRFRLLFKNPVLKYLLMTSSIFTFAIDIFYEFGPVYLTGTWLMTPAWIAVYNVALCFALSIGHGFLSHKLSISFSNDKIIITNIIFTALSVVLMVLWPSKFWVFILFSLIGLSIAVGTNSFAVEISNNAKKNMQGEVMGAQLGLRMLGDALICLVGGFVIILSVGTPLIISCVIALIAAGIYAVKFRK